MEIERKSVGRINKVGLFNLLLGWFKTYKQMIDKI